MMIIHKINSEDIDDWDKFHEYFFKEFHFPDYYGRNMNAWIDCMSDLNHEDQHVLHLSNISELKSKNKDIYEALIEDTAFVNWRFTEKGESPILYISFYK